MMNKTRINNRLYDVIPADEYLNNKNMYDPAYTAIEKNGLIYPLRKKKDTNPGYYSHGVIGFYMPPVDENEREEYSSKNIIDFSNAKSIKEVIEKSDSLREIERGILTTVDNITIPNIKDEDEPAMRALKKAITHKQIDIDKYEHRFGGKFNNDVRILNENSITLFKLNKFANALDLKCTLTIEDKNENVVNPMNTTISVVLNGDDESNE